MTPSSEEQPLTLLFVHGRGPQPPADTLESLWSRTLEAGLRRDHGLDLSGVRVEMAYHADLAEHEQRSEPHYDPELDLADSEGALRDLLQVKPKGFKRSRYEALPGHTPFREFLNDVGAPALRALGLGGWRLAHQYPELSAYWADPDLAARIRQRIEAPLLAACAEQSRILVIAHCIGSVFCYDTLWQLGRVGTLEKHRLDTWITLGSPLADNDVLTRLAGPAESFPGILLNWFNLAAEDDPVCHDETVADDFRALLSNRKLSRITDYHIYNLSVRYGRSDPHDPLGYLIHPRLVSLVANWINPASGT